MCDPLTIGAGALMAAGTAAQATRNSQINRAQNAANDRYLSNMRATNAERERLRGEQAQSVERSAARFDETLLPYQQNDPTQQAQDAGAARAERAFDLASSTAMLPTDAGEGRTSVVSEGAADRLARAVDEARQRIQAGAALGGFGDREFDAGMGLSRSAEDLNMEADTRRGLAGVAGRYGQVDAAAGDLYGAESQAARFKGQNLGLAGDFATGLGSLGLTYGLANAGGAAPQAQAQGFNTGQASVGPGFGGKYTGGTVRF